MTDAIQFTVGFPTDDGFIGRQCAALECARYFKVDTAHAEREIYCPYCGILADQVDLFTTDQLDHATNVASEHAREFAEREFRKMLEGVVRRSGGAMKLERRAQPYKARPVKPTYRERTVDSELMCPTCKCRFQVYGIFGYCPGCRTQNMRVYDADIVIIRKEVAKSDDKDRALRRAYADLISTFETFCKKKAPRAPARATLFQGLFESRHFFKEELRIDILQGLSQDELLAVRRVFQKRHVYQHNEGVVTELYIRKIPEDRELLGKVAPLSLTEFETAAGAIRKMITILSHTVDG